MNSNNISKWYLTRTKPRQEKRAVEHLENQGFIVYCPWLTYTKSKSRSDYKEPLFPGYVFLRDHGQFSSIFSKVRSTRGVSSFVTFGNNIATISDPLIQAIRLHEQSMRGCKEYKYKAGQVVEFNSGPFKDLEGIYLCNKGEDRCIILLNLVNRQQQIVIRQSQLKKSF
ncbi:hypothetical protein AB835_08710 [Candidatus Endobugula sertula]|uniref:NusG-like N-terminal domain-containing protein n=1 Tax=Candidatus Endobugula sertula TaxID=62101 RepID=A0A1D2QPI4_9GAMM|nr:hypothetical protein AB835_08710 [Candidatus Endobugula sertula]